MQISRFQNVGNSSLYTFLQQKSFAPPGSQIAKIAFTALARLGILSKFEPTGQYYVTLKPEQKADFQRTVALAVQVGYKLPSMVEKRVQENYLNLLPDVLFEQPVPKNGDAELKHIIQQGLNDLTENDIIRLRNALLRDDFQNDAAIQKACAQLKTIPNGNSLKIQLMNELRGMESGRAHAVLRALFNEG